MALKPGTRPAVSVQAREKNTEPVIGLDAGPQITVLREVSAYFSICSFKRCVAYAHLRHMNRLDLCPRLQNQPKIGSGKRGRRRENRTRNLRIARLVPYLQATAAMDPNET